MASIIIATTACSQHLLPNVITCNRHHSSTAKTTLTKQSFNAFLACITAQSQSTFRSKIESSMQALSKESQTIKYDNDQRHIKTISLLLWL
ncbi:unnamed protein product [Rotaria sp. Silwood2]|nr:unnamed protein product [Rotaria sp. Silwood2]CAF4632570.1 unnamed protein product [Rotaria sp. Silwood2]